VSSIVLAEIDAQYRQLREDCAFSPRPSLRMLAVRGSEAGDYLQSQLTKDLSGLTPGRGAYAALLDRKAHIQADMRVLCLAADDFLLVIEEAGFERTLKHLDMYRIGREAEVTDVSNAHAIVSVIGPGLESRTGLNPGTAEDHSEANLGTVRCRALASPIGSLPALDLIVAAEEEAALVEQLTAAGLPEVGEEATELLRIEAGLPRYGREITTDFMPAEVGIVSTAVSFDKGCYIGQEPVARLHYKGRPNRHLRRLRFDRPVEAGAQLLLDGKEVGTVSTSGVSPASGPIGLAIVRREAEPGSRLTIADSEASAVVEEIEADR
jgi:folate-binding protein YgfZ